MNAARAAFLQQLATTQLLYIDDFDLAPLTDQAKRDLLRVLEDRYDKSANLITCQLPVDQWHAYINEPTLADAVLDRLAHNAYRLQLKGGSMRQPCSHRPTEKLDPKIVRRPAPLNRPASAGITDRHGRNTL